MSENDNANYRKPMYKESSSCLYKALSVCVVILLVINIFVFYWVFKIKDNLVLYDYITIWLTMILFFIILMIYITFEYNIRKSIKKSEDELEVCRLIREKIRQLDD